MEVRTLSIGGKLHKSKHRFCEMDMRHEIDRSRSVFAIHPHSKLSPAGKVAETGSLEPDALGAGSTD